MDATERALIATTVGDALAATFEGTTRTTDETLFALGWLDLLAAEPDVAIAVGFEALGRTNRAATVLDDVIAVALGVEPGPQRAVLLPRFGVSQAPGHLDDGIVRAEGLTSVRIASVTELLVVVRDHADLGLAMVAASDATTTAVHGIDPEAELYLVECEAAAPTIAPVSHARWESAIAIAWRVVAHQLAGASRSMLDHARAHAVERVQFGRPIASFQAVRHRLADVLVAVEACASALDAAAEGSDPRLAALAKVIAGRTARTVALHAQQILAGVGFTTDHPFHHYLKRTMLLDGLLGSADDLTIELGRRLLAARVVPTLIEL